MHRRAGLPGRTCAAKGPASAGDFGPFVTPWCGGATPLGGPWRAWHWGSPRSRIAQATAARCDPVGDALGLRLRRRTPGECSEGRQPDGWLMGLGGGGAFGFRPGGAHRRAPECGVAVMSFGMFAGNRARPTLHAATKPTGGSRERPRGAGAGVFGTGCCGHTLERRPRMWKAGNGCVSTWRPPDVRKTSRSTRAKTRDNDEGDGLTNTALRTFGVFVIRVNRTRGAGRSSDAPTGAAACNP